MSDADPPLAAVRAAVQIALAEDAGVLGDITSIACVDERRWGAARFVARQAGVVAGVRCADETYRALDPAVQRQWHLADGDEVHPGTVIGTVSGPMRSILGGERVALNFMSHLSGVASLTNSYVQAAQGRCRIRDTRKTIPGLRALQKAAVRAGGGHNHRDSLSDAVLIKDNHVAVLGITPAVQRARQCWPGRVVEVECDTLEQVAEARAAGADLILVDNMTPEQVRVAVASLEGAVPVEVSGGVDLTTVAAYARTGAEYIAIGALTHSVRVLDIGLDVVEAPDGHVAEGD